MTRLGQQLHRKKGAGQPPPHNTGCRSALRGSVPPKYPAPSWCGKSQGRPGGLCDLADTVIGNKAANSQPGAEAQAKALLPSPISVHPLASAVRSLPLHGCGLPEWHPGKVLRTPPPTGDLWGGSTPYLLPDDPNPKRLLFWFRRRIMVPKILPFTVCAVGITLPGTS